MFNLDKNKTEKSATLNVKNPRISWCNITCWNGLRCLYVKSASLIQFLPLFVLGQPIPEKKTFSLHSKWSKVLNSPPLDPYLLTYLRCDLKSTNTFIGVFLVPEAPPGVILGMESPNHTYNQTFNCFSFRRFLESDFKKYWF